MVNNAVEYALTFIGRPYSWGGNSPIRGFDCSGLSCEVLKAFGILHFSEDLSAQDLAIRLAKTYDKCEPKEGAILFFGSLGKLCHVAIAINDKLMIEAGGGDSSVVTLEQAAVKSAFVRIRPIAMRKDFVIALDVFK